MTSSADDTPKYLETAEKLLAAIDEGRYAPGDRLPGEKELSELYGVSPVTARRALRVLARQGVAEGRRGAGYFVQSFPPIRSRRIPRLAQLQWGDRKSIWSADEQRPLTIDQFTVEVLVPPRPIAEKLGLGQEERACCRSRRYVVDGRPVQYARSYLPYSLVADTQIMEQDTGPGGIFARLSELGHVPRHHDEEVRGSVPTRDEIVRLGIPEDRPVLRILRTTATEDGRPVEVSDIVMDAAAYVLEYAWDA